MCMSVFVCMCVLVCVCVYVSHDLLSNIPETVPMKTLFWAIFEHVYQQMSACYAYVAI